MIENCSYDEIGDIKKRLDFFTDEMSILLDNRKYLRQQQIVYSETEMQNRIACMLSSLRSILDYAMMTELIEFTPKHSQFPLYNESYKNFATFMRKHNKELPTNHSTYHQLEKLQYYNDALAKQWMKILHDLSNKEKHTELPGIKLKNEKQVVIHSSDGYAPIKINQTGSMSIGSTTHPFAVINGEDIRFEGDISVKNFPHINHPNIHLRNHKVWYFKESGDSVESVLKNIHSQIKGVFQILIS